MISTSEFKKGVVIRIDGRLAKIIDFMHVKPGKGGAFVKTKFKDMITGQVLNKTFRSGEKVEDVYIERKSMQFLYSDDSGYNFMDNTEYEQITLSEEMVGEDKQYLKENMDVFIQFEGDKPIGIEMPPLVDYKVVHTEPGIKGDTVSGATKPATVETGLIINVPLFVEIGNVIKIDTRENKYISRV